MLERWYYTIQGKTHGPVAIEDVIRLATIGALAPNELLWPEDFDPQLAFKASATIDFSALPPPPPGAPPAPPPAEPAQQGLGNLPDWIADVQRAESSRLLPPQATVPDWVEDIRKLEQERLIIRKRSLASETRRKPPVKTPDRRTISRPQRRTDRPRPAPTAVPTSAAPATPTTDSPASTASVPLPEPGTATAPLAPGIEAQTNLETQVAQAPTVSDSLPIAPPATEPSPLSESLPVGPAPASEAPSIFALVPDELPEAPAPVFELLPTEAAPPAELPLVSEIPSNEPSPAAPGPPVTQAAPEGVGEASPSPESLSALTLPKLPVTEAPPLEQPSAPSPAETGFQPDTGVILDAEKFKQWQRKERMAQKEVLGETVYEAFRRARRELSDWADQESSEVILMEQPLGDIKQHPDVLALIDSFQNYGPELRGKLWQHLEFLVENRKKFFASRPDEFPQPGITDTVKNKSNDAPEVDP